jgi:hypothetical protein
MTTLFSSVAPLSLWAAPSTACTFQSAPFVRALMAALAAGDHGAVQCGLDKALQLGLEPQAPSDAVAGGGAVVSSARTLGAVDAVRSPLVAQLDASAARSAAASINVAPLPALAGGHALLPLPSLGSQKSLLPANGRVGASVSASTTAVTTAVPGARRSVDQGGGGAADIDADALAASVITNAPGATAAAAAASAAAPSPFAASPSALVIAPPGAAAVAPAIRRAPLPGVDSLRHAPALALGSALAAAHPLLAIYGDWLNLARRRAWSTLQAQHAMLLLGELLDALTACDPDAPDDDGASQPPEAVLDTLRAYIARCCTRRTILAVDQERAAEAAAAAARAAADAAAAAAASLAAATAAASQKRGRGQSTKQPQPPLAAGAAAVGSPTNLSASATLASAARSAIGADASAMSALDAPAAAAATAAATAGSVAASASALLRDPNPHVREVVIDPVFSAAEVAALCAFVAETLLQHWRLVAVTLRNPDGLTLPSAVAVVVETAPVALPAHSAGTHLKLYTDAQARAAMLAAASEALAGTFADALAERDATVAVEYERSTVVASRRDRAMRDDDTRRQMRPEEFKRTVRVLSNVMAPDTLMPQLQAAHVASAVSARAAALLDAPTSATPSPLSSFAHPAVGPAAHHAAPVAGAAGRQHGANASGAASPGGHSLDWSPGSTVSDVHSSLVARASVPLDKRVERLETVALPASTNTSPAHHGKRHR